MEEVRRLCDATGFLFRDEAYRDNRFKHLVECKKQGHLTRKAIKNLRQQTGIGCEACSMKSVEEVRLLGQKVGLEFLGTEYQGNNIKYPWKCLSAGHLMMKTAASCTQKRGCQKCYWISRKKYKTPIEWKIAKNLRGRINQAVKRNSRAGSAVRDLGMSIAEFRIYIEARFEPDMTWKNYGRGKGKWSFDHIRPLDSFDLSVREEFLKAAHYTNLQPMWAPENSSKRDRW
jgi:hypothetical protein